MDFTGYPNDHNLFELGYCVHTQFSHSKSFLDQASDLILSQFQEEEHPFIRKAIEDKNIHAVELYYVYKPKTDTPRIKNTDDDEIAYKFGPKYGGEFTGFHQHMISVVVFSYSENLKVYWLNVQLQKWVFLMIIMMLIQITKSLGDLVSLPFSFTLPNLFLIVYWIVMKNKSSELTRLD